VSRPLGTLARYEFTARLPARPVHCERMTGRRRGINAAFLQPRIERLASRNPLRPERFFVVKPFVFQ